MKKMLLVLPLLVGIGGGLLGFVHALLTVYSTPNVEDIYVLDNLRRKEMQHDQFVVLVVGETCESCRKALSEWGNLSREFSMPVYIVNVNAEGGKLLVEYVEGSTTVVSTPAVYVRRNSSYARLPLRTAVWDKTMQELTGKYSLVQIVGVSAGLLLTCIALLVLLFLSPSSMQKRGESGS